MTKRDIGLPVAVFVFTLLMFARLMFCDFTWWDDPQTIHHNPLLNPPTWSALVHYWTAMGPASPMGLYVPVTYTLWWLLAWAAQRPATVDQLRLNPAFYHGANVLLHATSAMLVFVVLRRIWIEFRVADGPPRPTSRSQPHGSRQLRGITRDVPADTNTLDTGSPAEAQTNSKFPALAGALLFAIHPVQVEAVAWASGTKDLLCGLFTLIAVERYLCVARSKGRGQSVNYAATLVAVLLAMLSKPTAVVAPLLLLAIGYLALHRTPRELQRQLWPMLALMIPCAVVAGWSQPSTFSSPVALIARPFVAADSIGFYLGKLIWPSHLSPDYGRSPEWLLRTGRLYAVGSLSLLLMLILCVLTWRSRLSRLALMLFLIPLMPVLGLRPFLYQYHSTVTDHYLYLPMLGIGLLLGVACTRLPTFVVVSLLVLLGARTLTREPAWQNTRTLFAAAVADDPTTFGNFDMLGFTYALDASRAARAGDIQTAGLAAQRAVDLYTKAIALNPLDVPARDNLARIELNRGNRAAAVAQVRQIIAIQPQLPNDLRASPVDLRHRLSEYAADPSQ